MIQHIFKMLWSQRKYFAGIFVEQLLIFIILMLCMVSVAQKGVQYYSPGLLQTDHTVYFGYMFRQDRPSSQSQYDEMGKQMQNVIHNLREKPYVTAISESYGFLPYLRELYSKDSITIDQRKVEVEICGSDQFGWQVLRPKLIEGEWLTDKMLPDGSYPSVITRQLAEAVGWQQTVGRKIQLFSKPFTVVGLIEGKKIAPFDESAPTIIISGPLTMQMSRYMEYGARLKPNMQDEFFKDYIQEFHKNITLPNVEPSMGDLDKQKNNMLITTTLGLIFRSVPTGFFLIFGFIGTFGLFWLYSRKRLEEFALRRAIGATKNRLVGMVMTESVVLTLLAAIPGLVLAGFIYSWDGVVVIGVGATLAVMLLFSVFSAWYPAWKVSRVSPAEALHNE